MELLILVRANVLICIAFLFDLGVLLSQPYVLSRFCWAATISINLSLGVHARARLFVCALSYFEQNHFAS